VDWILETGMTRPVKSHLTTLTEHLHLCFGPQYHPIIHKKNVIDVSGEVIGRLLRGGYVTKAEGHQQFPTQTIYFIDEKHSYEIVREVAIRYTEYPDLCEIKEREKMRA
jgi:hypothetical protein